MKNFNFAVCWCSIEISTWNTTMVESTGAFHCRMLSWSADMRMRHLLASAARLGSVWIYLLLSACTWTFTVPWFTVVACNSPVVSASAATSLAHVCVWSRNWLLKSISPNLPTSSFQLRPLARLRLCHAQQGWLGYVGFLRCSTWAAVFFAGKPCRPQMVVSHLEYPFFSWRNFDDVICFPPFFLGCPQGNTQHRSNSIVGLNLCHMPEFQCRRVSLPAIWSSLLTVLILLRVAETLSTNFADA